MNIIPRHEPGQAPQALDTTYDEYRDMVLGLQYHNHVYTGPPSSAIHDRELRHVDLAAVEKFHPEYVGMSVQAGDRPEAPTPHYLHRPTGSIRQVLHEVDYHCRLIRYRYAVGYYRPGHSEVCNAELENACRGDQARLDQALSTLRSLSLRRAQKEDDAPQP